MNKHILFQKIDLFRTLQHTIYSSVTGRGHVPLIQNAGAWNDFRVASSRVYCSAQFSVA